MAAADSADDWFRFEVKASQNSVESTPVIRLPVAAFIGETPWAQFHVDLVGPGVAMTGVPEPAPPLISSVAPQGGRDAYLVYPLVDHVADKVAAMFSHYGSAGLASTRYRDLVDLVAIVMGASIDAPSQMNALQSEETRRGIELPTTFKVPHLDSWEGGYAEEVRKLNVTQARSLEAALAIVKPFLDPLLDDTAEGVWDPDEQAWRRQ